MSWNYRIVKKIIPVPDDEDEEYYEIHEVYYNKEGKIHAITVNPISPYGTSIDELKQSLVYMQGAFEKEILIDGEIEFFDKEWDDDDDEL